MPYLGAGNDLCVNLAGQVTALRTALAELADPMRRSTNLNPAGRDIRSASVVLVTAPTDSINMAD